MVVCCLCDEVVMYVGSVAVVGAEDASPLADMNDGEEGPATMLFWSITWPLTDPAVELAVLCGALAFAAPP